MVRQKQSWKQKKKKKKNDVTQGKNIVRADISATEIELEMENIITELMKVQQKQRQKQKKNKYHRKNSGTEQMLGLHKIEIEMEKIVTEIELEIQKRNKKITSRRENIVTEVILVQHEENQSWKREKREK